MRGSAGIELNGRAQGQSPMHPPDRSMARPVNKFKQPSGGIPRHHKGDRAGKVPLETNRSTRHYPIMDNETEASHHFRKAARAAREASRLLAVASEDRRNTAVDARY